MKQKVIKCIFLTYLESTFFIFWGHDSFFIFVKAISGEEYTGPADLFVHYLSCKKSYLTHYAPLFMP
jgi:hypothetical protein